MKLVDRLCITKCLVEICQFERFLVVKPFFCEKGQMFLEQYSKGMSYDLACSIWLEKFLHKKNGGLIKVLQKTK